MDYIERLTALTTDELVAMSQDRKTNKNGNKTIFNYLSIIILIVKKPQFIYRSEEIMCA